MANGDLGAFLDNLQEAYRPLRPTKPRPKVRRKADARGFVEVRPSERELARRKLMAAQCKRVLARLRKSAEKAEDEAMAIMDIAMCVPGRASFFR